MRTIRPGLGLIGICSMASASSLRGNVGDAVLLPGADSVGQCFDILYSSRDGIEHATAALFDYELNKTTLDSEFKYPWVA